MAVFDFINAEVYEGFNFNLFDNTPLQYRLIGETNIFTATNSPTSANYSFTYGGGFSTRVPVFYSNITLLGENFEYAAIPILDGSGNILPRSASAIKSGIINEINISNSSTGSYGSSIKVTGLSLSAETILTLPFSDLLDAASAGNDQMFGSRFADIVEAGTGNDEVYGNDGNDKIYGDNGDDYLVGENGDDQIFGENGSDWIVGGAGNDWLVGGEGYDTLIGGDGDDGIAFDGNDNLEGYSGGAGYDTLFWNEADGGNPYLFNLASHGFEQAIVSRVDGANEIWASNTRIFNAAWGLETSDYTNDDGTRAFYRFDPSNNQSWREIQSFYSTDGRLDYEQTLYDDGGRLLLDFDLNNVALWNSRTLYFNPNGILTSDTTVADPTSDDVITGGNGNDVIGGGIGNDTLTGGAGNDSFDDLSGVNIITDFVAGGTEDSINLEGMAPIHRIANFSVVQGLASQIGADTTIILGYKSALILKNVKLSDLTAADFTNYGTPTFTSYLNGTSASETITGTNATEVIDAGAGDDVINTASGSDTVLAGSGNDTINSGQLGNRLSGGEGNDIINSRGSADTISGGSGQNYYYRQAAGLSLTLGGNDVDTFVGGDAIASEDEFYGFGGEDNARGGSGNDTLFGGLDNDLLIGQDGNDNLNGEEGNDQLFGENGNDWITGGAGNDWIVGGAGFDTVIAGDGDDGVVFDANDNFITYFGGEGYDTLFIDFTTDGTPTYFDLASHGFEQAIVNRVDTSGQIWATNAQVHDAAWRLVKSDYTNDDGSRTIYTYDPNGSQSWSEIRSFYTSSGSLDYEQTFFDDGATLFLDFDLNSDAVWYNRMMYTNAAGVVTSDTFVLDAALTQRSAEIGAAPKKIIIDDALV